MRGQSHSAAIAEWHFNGLAASIPVQQKEVVPWPRRHGAASRALPLNNGGTVDERVFALATSADVRRLRIRTHCAV